jgi:23S rRNA pseudouridine1911/1915/1917 synthase
MIDVLFEDPHILAVNKPAGLATTGRIGSGTSLADAVGRHLDADGSASPFLGTVHRLDKPVSGVVLWAKNERAARRLSRQFADRTTTKVYVALVSGLVSPDRGQWVDWLYEADAGLGVVQVCKPGAPRARRAVTRYEVDRELPSGDSRLILMPETGRTHQLRVQSGSRGHPILGDVAYGSTRPFPDGIALHARSLTVSHPITGEAMTFTAPFPVAWDALDRSSSPPSS